MANVSCFESRTHTERHHMRICDQQFDKGSWKKMQVVVKLVPLVETYRWVKFAITHLVDTEGKCLVRPLFCTPNS